MAVRRIWVICAVLMCASIAQEGCKPRFSESKNTLKTANTDHTYSASIAASEQKNQGASISAVRLTKTQKPAVKRRKLNVPVVESSRSNNEQLSVEYSTERHEVSDPLIRKNSMEFEGFDEGKTLSEIKTGNSLENGINGIGNPAESSVESSLLDETTRSDKVDNRKSVFSRGSAIPLNVNRMEILTTEDPKIATLQNRVEKSDETTWIDGSANKKGPLAQSTIGLTLDQNRLAVKSDQNLTGETTDNGLLDDANRENSNIEMKQDDLITREYFSENVDSSESSDEPTPSKCVCEEFSGMGLVPGLGRIKRNDELLDSIIDPISDHSLSKGLVFLFSNTPSWLKVVADSLNAETPISSSQELWGSFGGDTMVKIINRNWEQLRDAYPAIVAVLLLASELAIKPTKVGMTPFNVDDPGLQQVCSYTIDEKFQTGLQSAMEMRLNRRATRWSHEYHYEYVFKSATESVFHRHPMANVAVVCSVQTLSVKYAILNHQFGRRISEVVQEDPSFVLAYPNMDFDIRTVLAQIRDASVEQLLAGVKRVQYDNSDGVGPGVVRDWFGKVVERLFDPKNGFFVLPENDKEVLVYRINVANAQKVEYVEFFHAIGRIFAMSLMDGNPMRIVMNSGIYQILMCKISGWDDLDLLKDDVMLHNSWKTIMDSENVSLMGLETTSLDQLRHFVIHPSSDLPSGVDISDLTPDNVAQWSQLAIDDHMFGKTVTAYTAMVNGFYELLPQGGKTFYQLFSPDELQELLVGELSAEALIEAMSYEYPHNANSQIIKWLHEILIEAKPSFLSKFLFFVTGLRALPFGFGKTDTRKIKISLINSDPMKLPEAHTCNYTLDLYKYPSKQILLAKLEKAVPMTDMPNA